MIFNLQLTDRKSYYWPSIKENVLDDVYYKHRNFNKEQSGTNDYFSLRQISATVTLLN